MRKKIITFIFALLMILSFSSCELYTYATTQDDIYVESESDIVHINIDYNLIVRYGTPYYYNGSILYYLYEGLYYYPFYYNNCWYIRAYRKPFTHLYHHPYFRPHRYDYRFDRGYRPHYNWYRDIRPNNNSRNYDQYNNSSRNHNSYNHRNENRRNSINSSPNRMNRIDSRQGNYSRRQNIGGRR